MSRDVPMLFSGHLVRAILEGRKTQTRRPINGIPSGSSPESQPATYAPLRVDRKGEEYPAADQFGIWGDGWDVKAPCAPGDTIWVRETWRPAATNDGHECFAYAADRSYRCGKPYPGVDCVAKWKPSIHRPRRAARIFLEVVSVRAECIAAISDSDAIAEGFKDSSEFTSAWAGIYGSCEGWCWVIEFKRRPAPNNIAERRSQGGDKHE